LRFDGAVLLPAQVLAEPKIYAYPASATFCPQGLRRVHDLRRDLLAARRTRPPAYQQMSRTPRRKSTRSATITPAAPAIPALARAKKGLPLSRSPFDDRNNHQKIRRPSGIGFF